MRYSRAVTALASAIAGQMEDLSGIKIQKVIPINNGAPEDLNATLIIITCTLSSIKSKLEKLEKTVSTKSSRLRQIAAHYR